jgi:hypothetical protein
MATNWSQENCDASTSAEREVRRDARVYSNVLVPRPAPRSDEPLTNRAEEEVLPAAGNSRRKPLLLGWDVMLAVLAGGMIFFFLDVASLGILSSAVTVAGLVTAFGLGHYLLWGRWFGRSAVRAGQQVQPHAGRLETDETEPSDEFLLGLNDRQRTQLLQLLERSLPAATGVREGSDDGAAIRRELRDRIRMFGA